MVRNIAVEAKLVADMLLTYGVTMSDEEKDAVDYVLLHSSMSALMVMFVVLAGAITKLAAAIRATLVQSIAEKKDAIREASMPATSKAEPG